MTVPDDRMLSEEEIRREWEATQHPGTGARFMSHWADPLGQIFARRIEALVRERIAERLEHEADKWIECSTTRVAWKEAARLVRGAK